MKFYIVPLVLLLTAGLPVIGQGINVGRLDSFLNALSSRGLAMGSLAISKEGDVTYQKSMGFSFLDADKKMAAGIDTRYRIGSATKMFTAVMVFQLIEEGKLRLDQRLKEFFPDLPNAGTITIGQLLQHRSGLHDYTRETNFPAWMDIPKSQEELINIIREKGSDFEPGTKADYSNSNYLLLGYIIEGISKMTYAEALAKKITNRLELKNTFYGHPVSKTGKESASYKYANSTWTREKETALNNHGGAGSIVSTPTDMVKFMDALFSGKLVSEASLTTMETIVDGYGMGMFPNRYGDKPAFGHNGRVEEFYTALWYFPGEKLALAYCTNGINYPRTDIMTGVLKICFNEPFQIPFGNTDTSTAELDQYTGKYASEQILVNCTKEGTELLIETKGKTFQAKKIAKDYFMNAESGYYFEFYPGKAELLIKETDNVYYLKKTN